MSWASKPVPVKRLPYEYTTKIVEFHLFFGQEQLQKHATLDKKSILSVYTKTRETSTFGACFAREFFSRDKFQLLLAVGDHLL